MTLFGWVGLAGTTFAAALLQAVSGFGFAVLAVPLYLLLVAPAQAVQLAIILATALSIRRGSGTAAYHRSGAVATINSGLEWTRWLSASLRFRYSVHGAAWAKGAVVRSAVTRASGASHSDASGQI